MGGTLLELWSSLAHPLPGGNTSMGDEEVEFRKSLRTWGGQTRTIHTACQAFCDFLKGTLYVRDFFPGNQSSGISQLSHYRSLHNFVLPQNTGVQGLWRILPPSIGWSTHQKRGHTTSAEGTPLLICQNHLGQPAPWPMLMGWRGWNPGIWAPPGELDSWSAHS